MGVPLGVSMLIGGSLSLLLGGIGYSRLRRHLLRQTRRLEDALTAERNARERYGELFANASDVILHLNLDGRVVSANRAAEQLLTRNGAALASQFVEELFATDDPGWYFDAVDAVRRSGGARVERELVNADGERITLELNCRMQADHGFETGLLAIGRDITQRIRLQQEMERARLAAESNALAKSIFLANMSHEIRTPMNGILGMTRLLLETPLNLEQRDQASTIQHSAEALLSILNDILDLSRIEAGKLELAQESFDLPAVFEEVMELLAPIARTKDREFLFDFPPDLPARYFGDAGRLRQVVLNLVGNALKFTEQGFVEIRVTGRPNELFCELLIEVEDSGIGMTNAQAARMFQPFEQADLGTQRQFGGTGLGLALSKKIVHAMGGEIGVRSTPGAGSVFWIIVRLGVDRAERTAFIPRLPGVRVWCDIESPRLRQVVGRWLATHGAILTEEAPELWVADLPVVPAPGLRSARRLLLSRDPSPLVGEAAGRLGFQAWLRQPVRQQELIETLEALRVSGFDAMLGPGALRRQTEFEPIQATLSGLRILLAEDNRVNQKVVTGILKRTGCTFSVVENGALAVDAVQKHEFDVVLMDCHMPVMDGYTAARRIRGLQGPAGSVPIVALTAGALAEDRDRCGEAGMDHFLAKPFRAEDLLELLSALRSGANAVALG